jgi:predicted CoA-binding protein
MVSYAPGVIVDDEASLAAIVRSFQTMAVVGMKDERTPRLPAFEIPRTVQARGVRVFPVNPFIQSALGEPAVPSLAALGRRVDLVDVFRRVSAIPDLAEQILALPASLRPEVVWLQTGIRHDEAARRLSDAGITVVQDRCLGVYVSRYRR